MNWIDTEFIYFSTPTDDINFFLNLLKENIQGIDVDLAIFSGIYTIDGELGWFEEKLVQGFDKDISEKVNPNGSLVKLRLKYLYSINPDAEFKKIFYNGESLFGD